MSDENDRLEWNAAGDLVAFAFMREILLELARREPNPAEWARGFIERLHARQAHSEARADQFDPDGLLRVHELARAG
jgi:hypothetical protein